MAQNTFVNVTLSKGAASQPDRLDHKHVAGAGTSATGDLSIAWDSVTVTNLSSFDSAIAAARQVAISRGLK